MRKTNKKFLPSAAKSQKNSAYNIKNLASWLKSKEAEERRKAIEESSKKFSESIMNSLKIDKKLLHLRVTI